MPKKKDFNEYREGKISTYLDLAPHFILNSFFFFSFFLSNEKVREKLYVNLIKQRLAAAVEEHGRRQVFSNLREVLKVVLFLLFLKNLIYGNAVREKKNPSVTELF